MQVFIGFLLAFAVASIAYWARSLNTGGAIAATIVGAVVFGMGGLQWAALLLIFFISSSALSRAFKTEKQGLDEKFSKGHARDAGQVFGNGGLATAFVLVHFFLPETEIGWVGFAASIAAVNADTWATELGVMNTTPPRLITNLRKRVEKGTSGGVSPLGTFASFLGASAIALPAAWFTGNWLLLPLVALAGIAGSLFDSLLGATLQAMYYCPADEKETEKHPIHTCGARTVHIRGWKWLDNDWVNFMCSAIGVLVALIFFL